MKPKVKAKANLSPRDLKGLVALAEERKLKRYVCASLEPRARRLGEVTVLPCGEFLVALWDGEFS